MSFFYFYLVKYCCNERKRSNIFRCFTFYFYFFRIIRKVTCCSISYCNAAIFSSTYYCPLMYSSIFCKQITISVFICYPFASFSCSPNITSIFTSSCPVFIYLQLFFFSLLFSELLTVLLVNPPYKLLEISNSRITYSRFK